MSKDDARRALYVRAKAQARLADARLVFREEIEAAAERIAEQLDGEQVEAPELGFLDGVLDVLDAVGHAVERLVEDIFTIEGPWIVDDTGTCGPYPEILTIEVGAADVGGVPIEGPVTGGKQPGQMSAEQLLAARQALVEGRDRRRMRLREILEAIRAHEAMRREERTPRDE